MCNKWISVEDRLPEEGEDVLFYDGFDNFGRAYIVKHPVGFRWFMPGIGTNKNITHWQPLPERPEPLDE